MVRQHHEKLDGSGYPLGLKGDEILLESRVLAVADMVEAMASDRPYRRSRGLEFALKQVESEAGTLLRPGGCAHLLQAFPRKAPRGARLGLDLISLRRSGSAQESTLNAFLPARMRA